MLVRNVVIDLNWSVNVNECYCNAIVVRLLELSGNKWVGRASYRGECNVGVYLWGVDVVAH